MLAPTYKWPVPQKTAKGHPTSFPVDCRSATVTMLEASPERIVTAREQPQRIVDFRQHVLNLTSGVDIRPHDFKGAFGAAGSGGAPWQAPTAFVWVHEDPTGAKHTRVAKRARRCSSSVGNSSDGGGSSRLGHWWSWSAKLAVLAVVRDAALGPLVLTQPLSSSHQMLQASRTSISRQQQVGR